MFRLTFLLFLLTITRILSQVSFICKSGDLLNGIEKVCNGRGDCADGSDEVAELCSHTFCSANHFKCNYGACVHRSKKCNGAVDCVDGSDEANCGRKRNSCAPTEFNCGYNEDDDNDSYRYCIDASKLCDKTRDCANAADENEAICENTLCPEHSFRCNYGGCVSETVLCDGFFDCFDGSDESQELCVTLKCPKCATLISCPKLVDQNIESNRLNMKCEWNDRRMSCTQYILPGTKVSYSCKDHFTPKSAKDSSNDWNLCQADGTWLRDVLECKPNCGRLNVHIPLVPNAWKLSDVLPWHASLFVVENNQKPKYICGATLISEAVILTAAHCVWKIKAEDLRIGLGNLIPEFEHPDDFAARFYTVRDIIVHPTYLGQLGNYGSDIALIEIAQIIEIDETISPVCINWGSDDISTHMEKESLGMVVSLGSVNNSTSSGFFQVTKMPVITNQKCIDRQPAEFQKFLTFTTFCAGWANGTGVCNGDSGSGLIIPSPNNSNRYYLQGIVSLSSRQLSTEHCDPNQYRIFTKVGIYAQWIENHLNRINDRFNPQFTSEISDGSATQW